MRTPANGDSIGPHTEKIAEQAERSFYEKNNRNNPSYFTLPVPFGVPGRIKHRRIPETHPRRITHPTLTRTESSARRITSKNKLSDSTDTDSRGGVFRTVDEGDYGFAVYEDSGKVSVYAYYGTDKNVTTPYKFNGTVVTEIFGGAFAHTSVVSVSVSEGVTFIGEGAFTGSQLLERSHFRQP